MGMPVRADSRLSPSTKSIVKKWRAPSEPTSWTGTMLGWRSAAAERVSRRKRSTSVLLGVEFGRSVLSATIRFSSVSHAL
ncbi:MAG: hypothetical protein HYZ53_20725 [Planctomycetes bacterium]|nr:hypothetical protein [Planctomycetota bacterium]